MTENTFEKVILKPSENTTTEEPETEDSYDQTRSSRYSQELTSTGNKLVSNFKKAVPIVGQQMKSGSRLALEEMGKTLKQGASLGLTNFFRSVGEMKARHEPPVANYVDGFTRGIEREDSKYKPDGFAEAPHFSLNPRFQAPDRFSEGLAASQQKHENKATDPFKIMEERERERERELARREHHNQNERNFDVFDRHAQHLKDLEQQNTANNHKTPSFRGPFERAMEHQQNKMDSYAQKRNSYRKRKH